MHMIGFWLKQGKAGETMANPSTTVLTQMDLGYISVPGAFTADHVDSLIRDSELTCSRVPNGTMIFY